MAGLLILLLLLCGLCLAYWLASRLVPKGKRFRVVKVFLLGSLFMILPFVEELYIMSSFRIYCGMHGGVQRLEPVDARYIELKNGWNSLAVLDIPNVRAVRFWRGDYKQDDIRFSWYGKEQASNCNDLIHQELLNSRMAVQRMFAAKAVAEGYCFVSPDASIAADVRAETAKIHNHIASTPFMISKMEEQSFRVVDVSSSKTLSEFVVLYAFPGRIRRALWPHYSPYICPATWLPGSEFEYPFGNKKYEFLKRAINRSGS